MTERQDQIIAAATELFLAEGVGVSTARIASAAGVSNGTLFNAFATKQDLIDAIYRQTKLGMFAALPAAGADVGRAAMRGIWGGYLGWARSAPQDHAVIHLLKQSGLASPQVVAEVDARGAPYVLRLNDALACGVIRGPTAGYVAALIFAQIDLVLAYGLTGADEDLAFDMLCTSLGL